jgi:hypothetical protein
MAVLDMSFVGKKRDFTLIPHEMDYTCAQKSGLPTSE